jgi:hypothetical protein
MIHEGLPIMAWLVMLGLLVLVGVLLFRTFRLLYEGECAPKAILLVGCDGIWVINFRICWDLPGHFSLQSGVFFFSNSMPVFDNSDVTLFYLASQPSQPLDTAISIRKAKLRWQSRWSKCCPDIL